MIPTQSLLTDEREQTPHPDVDKRSGAVLGDLKLLVKKKKEKNRKGGKSKGAGVLSLSRNRGRGGFGGWKKRSTCSNLPKSSERRGKTGDVRWEEPNALDYNSTIDGEEPTR